MTASATHVPSLLLQSAEPKHYTQIIHVLRRLVKLAQSREHAWPYLEAAKGLLDGFSDANCPLSTDDLHWLLVEAWNKGVHYFNERKLEDAERWMALAFSFSNFSAALAASRKELDEQYQACLKQLNQPGSDSRRSTDWQSRMGTRILAADSDIESRRISFG